MIALSSRFPRAPLLGILAIAVLSACGSEEAADSNDQGTDRAVAVTLAEAGQQDGSGHGEFPGSGRTVGLTV